MPKNFRKIPAQVERALKGLSENNITVGCALKIPAEDLVKGDLRHLGIRLESTGLMYPHEVIPPASRGKYSARNRLGYNIVRKDLGLQTQYHSVEAPNWGDTSRGTHTVDLPHNVYLRDYQSPRLVALHVHCDNEDAGRTDYTLSFQVDEVLDRRAETFRAGLLRALNLLQENVGVATVFAASSSLEEYHRSLKVLWEILPPGTKEEAVARVFRGREPSITERRNVEDRYTFLLGLHPKELVYGQTGLQRYFGALLADDLVVFENIEYGNAIYIMFKDWPTLSQRSRLELLSGRHGTDFERVPHTRQWQQRVGEIIAARRAATNGSTPPSKAS